MTMRGFTLIEVLAAILLIGIVLPVAMHGIQLATSVADVSRHKAEAAMLADSKLNELVVTHGWQNGELSGDFGEAHPEYRWSAELREWDASSLKEIDLYVTWNAAGREHSVTVSTLVDTEAY